ncbi:superoxide dismutase [Rhodanobacter sp. 115]|uniref:superoxide dismutase n=1 Tax=Rhodanobacter sp. FW021-MT20 TaxID=1162282 RepID=UPI000260DF22|nr:Fe-Mn family superoxide dismutase [Rhodanobacter sp. 115]EIL96205.1 manganese and iron superoxide dismutase [Rhodanobacter sp. 115]TAM41635.1 MAG: superoxide dismutase [Rhodanobacter sp.]
MTTITMPALAGKHVLKPLPFAPTALKRLSEKLIVSHYENNYGGAVRNLNNLEKQLAQVTKDTPAFVVGGLRQHELMYRNSMTLHEAYFGNLGGDGRAAGDIASAIAAAYGSMDAWETHFRLTGASLGGGSGWAILAFELMTGELRTVWSGHHTQVLETALPLLVMDMYEHSYQMDYGAAALNYIDAFFANVQWDEVNHRFAQAQTLHRTLVKEAGS